MTTNKIRYIIAVALLGIALLYTAYIIFSSIKEDNNHARVDRLYLDEIQQLEEGDIIMRKGFGYISNKITQILDEPYSLSHCGIIVFSKNNKPIVIHSVSSTLSDIDGVQSCSIKKFCNESHHNSIVVARLKNTNAESRRSIALKAKEFLAAQTPFDNSFDMTDNTKLYCTELVWKALWETQKIDIYPDKADFKKLGFNAMMDSNYFDIIINHQDTNLCKGYTTLIA